MNHPNNTTHTENPHQQNKPAGETYKKPTMVHPPYHNTRENAHHPNRQKALPQKNYYQKLTKQKHQTVPNHPTTQKTKNKKGATHRVSNHPTAPPLPLPASTIPPSNPRSPFLPVPFLSSPVLPGFPLCLCF